MKSIYLLLVILSLLVGACAETAPAPDTPTKEPATTKTAAKSERSASSAPVEATPTAQPVANTATETFVEEQRKIDDAVKTINENIGSYTQKNSTVQYQGAEYAVTKYMDKNGFVVKSEAIGGSRDWNFFALPHATSDHHLIYSSYYQETDNRYAPITRSIYHLGALTDLEPKRMLFINQDGITMKGEPLYQDEKDHKAALAQFFKS